jgi:hypothetical protein
MTAVVVIDSGIDPGHPLVRGRASIVAGPMFLSAGPVPSAPDTAVDHLGHGTAVTAVILRYPPVRAVTLHALRVFDRAPICDFAAVLHALAAAIALRPALINMSLGTTSLRYREQLEALAATAKAQGTRIVAPISYGGLPADPGNLPTIDAVVADANVLPQLPELRRVGDRFVWFASPLPPPDADGQRRLLARGDSLAVAHVTGCLLRSLPA